MASIPRADAAVDLVDQLRTRAVQQVLGALAGYPMHVPGPSLGGRTTHQPDLYTIEQVYLYREGDETYRYKIAVDVNVTRTKLED